MKLLNYTIRAYVKDRRYKSGERIVKTHSYQVSDPTWSNASTNALVAGLYPDPKFRVEVDLITG
jgi:hypothetical protein